MNDTNSSSVVNLNGVWQDSSNSSITYQVNEECSGGQCDVDATYLTDPVCPSGVGQQFMAKTPVFGNPPTTANDTMWRCGSSDNPIVENCSQPAYWETTFNATFTNSTISGFFIDQYWVWNESSSGAIIDCRINDTFPNTFSLIRATPTTTSYYSQSSHSSSAGPSSLPPGNQGSSGGSSSTSRSSNSTSTNSTSTTTSAQGHIFILIEGAATAAVVLIAIVAGVIYFLRKRP